MDIKRLLVKAHAAATKKIITWLGPDVFKNHRIRVGSRSFPAVQFMAMDDQLIYSIFAEEGYGKEQAQLAIDWIEVMGRDKQ
jgi:hypothetical protein